MTYDFEMKELTRLGKRRAKLQADLERNMQEIGVQVRLARAANISQEKIAAKVGLSRMTVIKLEQASN